MSTKQPTPFPGARFMVSPSGQKADWAHPAEIATRCPDWTDCTDMGDVEFDLFMEERRGKYPALVA
ncbi:hypothetical protein [Massilia haematophila]|uniref:Uncharacterized protein n=1 Tax=Massilia haematophila TaxID=457923 RepID=A0ABV7PDH7_9BURK